MKRIQNDNILSNYIDKYNVKSIFDNNIINHAKLFFYEKDEFILEAETSLEYYYLLVDGRVKISYLFENGKSMFLKFYKEFITIGDLELMKDKPIRCNVEAADDSYLIAIPLNTIKSYYMNNLNFLHHLVESLSGKLEATINNSSYNYIYPLINRLSSYLLENLTEENYVILDYSFKEIAQFLGTTYRHLNRIFKELEDKAIIKCNNKTIYILRKDELLELSKNSYLK